MGRGLHGASGSPSYCSTLDPCPSRPVISLPPSFPALCPFSPPHPVLPRSPQARGLLLEPGASAHRQGRNRQREGPQGGRLEGGGGPCPRGPALTLWQARPFLVVHGASAGGGSEPGRGVRVLAFSGRPLWIKPAPPPRLLPHIPGSSPAPGPGKAAWYQLEGPPLLPTKVSALSSGPSLASGHLAESAGTCSRPLLRVTRSLENVAGGSLPSTAAIVHACCRTPSAQAHLDRARGVTSAKRSCQDQGGGHRWPHREPGPPGTVLTTPVSPGEDLPKGRPSPAPRQG